MNLEPRTWNLELGEAAEPPWLRCFSLDELHRLGVHGEGRLSLLGALLQGVTALHEGHHCVQVVDGFLKPVQLEEGGGRKAKRRRCWGGGCQISEKSAANIPKMMTWSPHLHIW